MVILVSFLLLGEFTCHSLALRMTSELIEQSDADPPVLHPNGSHWLLEKTVGSVNFLVDQAGDVILSLLDGYLNHISEEEERFAPQRNQHLQRSHRNMRRQGDWGQGVHGRGRRGPGSVQRGRGGGGPLGRNRPQTGSQGRGVGNVRNRNAAAAAADH